MIVQGLVLLLAMGVVLVVVGQAFDSRSLHQVDTELVDDTGEFTSAAGARPTGQGLDTFASEYLRRQPLELGTVLMVQLAGHGAVGSEGSQILAKSPQIDRWLTNPPTQAILTQVNVSSSSYRILVSPITANQRRVGVLIAAKELSRVMDTSRNVLLLTAGEVGAALLLAMVSTYVLLRRILGIVAKVTVTAEHISREGPGRRLQERSTEDEVGRLVHTFNQMLARLEAAFQSQRRLLSDVSHQMRTPLTVMRGHLEVARRGGLSDVIETRETVDLVLDELEHTTALVDRMLFLGRSLEPDFIQPEPVDLRSFMADVYIAAQALASRRWELGAVPDVVVLLDRDKLRGVLLNLIDNAIKATQEPDTIRLEVELSAALAITVVDTGRGIPHELQERIFQRYERGPADQRGSGLGLAIVKAVTEAHGGQVRIESAPGAGCSVRIVLPASRVLVDQARPDPIRR
jgi:two-component system, OmpR family, sensor kinase